MASLEEQLAEEKKNKMKEVNDKERERI